jgi:DNA polymerase
VVFFDFEVFKYDWLVVAIDPIKKKEYVVVNSKTELEQLYKEYKRDIWVGFNCRDYDQYILKAILCGFNPKEMNDWIIVQDRKGWEFSSLLRKYSINLFDVMPNPPIGLKALEAFMGKNIHETSVDFNINRKLTKEEIQETISYCRDDVLNTIEVFLKRKGEFDAQLDLLKAFDLPLSCIGKTQAQLAAVIFDARKQTFRDEWNIRLPDNLQLGKYQFVADWFLDKNNHKYEHYVVGARGKKKKEKVHLECEIAGLPHIIAWGGIHAGQVIDLVCNPDEVIIDADAGQLYPNLMRIYNLLSRAARKPEMLNYILDTSMRLKAEGKKKEREPYKRQCNIVYGASGDKTNALYDPLMRNLVCVYGQVFFIDLIDKIEDIAQIINSNTDGIFFKVKRKDLPELYRRINAWEERTQLKMEYVEYTKFVSKDVNNYVAVRADGGIHAKGSYVKELSDLDYDLPIVNEAVKNYIVYGYSVEDTVYGCREFRKFQKVVKLSKLYEWVEHDNGQRTIKFDNKAYRTFASLDYTDGMLKACRVTDKGLEKKKFGGTADRCFIFNDDLTGVVIPDKLDRQWYISLSKERLRQFGIAVD